MADPKKMTMKQITLDKLRLSPRYNVRRIHETPIEPLASTIAACGLLQNLVAHPMEKGMFGVTSGGRRLAALQHLRDVGRIPAEHKLNVLMIDEEDALLASLAENIAREAMNPADEARAFRRLVEDGRTFAEVAAAFGVTERHVKARERLGKLAAPVFAAFEARTLSIEQAQAFAVVEDAERQAAVFEAWSKAASWERSAAQIRRMMLETRVSATSRLARFVGREAYEAAGGVVDEDLFGADVFFTDPALLETLAQRKLEAAADAAIAKGWKWAAVMLDADYAILRQLGRIYPDEVELDEADQARWDEIEAAMEDETLEDEAYQALDAERDALQARMTVWTPEQMATAGVVVHLDSMGEIAIEEGLQRAEDRVAPKASAPTTTQASEDDAPHENPDGDGADGEPDAAPRSAPGRVVLEAGGGAPGDGAGGGARAGGGKPRDPYSEALRADLRMALQGALQIAVAEDPALARDLLEFETVMQARADFCWRDGLLSLRVTSSTARMRCDGWRFDEEALALPGGRVDASRLETASADAAFAAFRAMPRADRDALLALAVADMVQAALPADTGYRHDVAGDWGALAKATKRLTDDAPPEIRRIWTPTKDNFLGRVSRAILLDIVEATLGATEARQLMGAKKGELVDHLHGAFNDEAVRARLDAEQRARLAVWIPAPLQIAAADDADADADDPDDDKAPRDDAAHDDDRDGGAVPASPPLAAE